MSPAEYQEPMLSDTLHPEYRPYDHQKKIQQESLQQEVLYLRSYSKGLEKKNLVLETRCDMLR